MRIAVIDLGTNTFNLLVADISGKDFCVLHTSKIGVSLGKNGIVNNQISKSAIQRALAAIKHFSEIWEELSVDEVVAIGTSAIRDAENKNLFIQVLKNNFNLSIEIVSGLEEAQLIYDGISLSVPFQQPSLIMDIGGGSTEFIHVAPNLDLQKTSENIGLLRIVESLELNDPLTSDNQNSIVSWLNINSQQLHHFPYSHTLIGAAGSFETFYEMLHKQHFPVEKSHATISRNSIDQLLNLLITSNLEERDSNKYIHPIRKQMIPVAAVKVKWIVEKFDIQEIIVSTYSLKEGVLKRYL